MFKKFAVAAALTLLASSSFAADKPRFYAGADLGASKASGFEGNYTSHGVFGGYQFHDSFGVEAGFRRLGSLYGYSVDQTSLSLLATGHLEGEFENISMYGRLGMNRMSGCNGTSCNKEKFMVGLGFGYDFSKHFTGRLEFQRPADHVSNVSLGLAYRF